jgi:hypothetical protein
MLLTSASSDSASSSVRANVSKLNLGINAIRIEKLMATPSTALEIPLVLGFIISVYNTRSSTKEIVRFSLLIMKDHQFNCQNCHEPFEILLPPETTKASFTECEEDHPKYHN